jgi:hypothetical protein
LIADIDFFPKTPSTFRFGEGERSLFRIVWTFLRSVREEILWGKEMKEVVPPVLYDVRARPFRGRMRVKRRDNKRRLLTKMDLYI